MDACERGRDHRTAGAGGDHNLGYVPSGRQVNYRFDVINTFAAHAGPGAGQVDVISASVQGPYFRAVVAEPVLDGRAFGGC
ncbi:hypothetical protein ARUE_c19720 [Arthrobacter sp. Rue61a]|nr:hypothetical protein ARUE_c19720 [Arthrobacter sp. Rue61a]